MFKTPDVLNDSLRDLPPKEAKAARAITKKFFEYDEYVTLELDTDTKRMRVCPRSEFPE